MTKRNIKKNKEKTYIVTRNFDMKDVIGKLSLLPGIKIPYNSVFSLSYTPLEWEEDKNGKKIIKKAEIHEVSLISDENYQKFLEKEKDL